MEPYHHSFSFATKFFKQLGHWKVLFFVLFIPLWNNVTKDLKRLAEGVNKRYNWINFGHCIQSQRIGSTLRWEKSSKLLLNLRTIKNNPRLNYLFMIKLKYQSLLMICSLFVLIYTFSLWAASSRLGQKAKWGLLAIVDCADKNLFIYKSWSVLAFATCNFYLFYQRELKLLHTSTTKLQRGNCIATFIEKLRFLATWVKLTMKPIKTFPTSR